MERIGRGGSDDGHGEERASLMCSNIQTFVTEEAARASFIVLAGVGIASEVRKCRKCRWFHLDVAAKDFPLIEPRLVEGELTVRHREVA